MLDNILDYLRIALYTLLVILGVLLYEAWVKDHPEALSQSQATTNAIMQQPNHFVPAYQGAKADENSAETVAKRTKLISSAKSKLIDVKTDVLDVTIDTAGGDIVATKLLQYKAALGSSTPFTLLNDDPASRYIAESGLLSKIGPDTSAQQALYSTDQTHYELTPSTQGVTVKLHWQKDGILVTKTFSFTRGSYEINVGYQIENTSSKPWEGNLYTQLMRLNTPPKSTSGVVNLATYFGAAISTPEKPFEKITFKQMQERDFSGTTKDGWAAMIQHYFISAWVPPKNKVSTYYSKVSPDGLYTIGMIGEPLKALPGQTVTMETNLYSGPTIASTLEKIAPSLKLTIDYGWFWFISGIIFWMMQKIYDVIGNWGWSIVLVTIIIKLIFYQLSAKSYRSMSALKKLQPRIEALKERFGEDKQKLTQATIELYRQEKVNPMTGCLPILIQIPVFIALYWVLVESVQLRQAPFIFWIHDLSQHDPFYVLPILMGISMFIQQRLNPPPPDPLQAKVMMLMPVIFTVLFANFPSGLMLYWFVNNTLSFLQQWHIMRSVNNATTKKKS